MGIFNIIIVIILIIVVIWGLRNLFFKTNIIYDVMCDAAKPVELQSTVNSLFVSNTNVIMAKDIPENSSSNFTLSVWFYIDNWGNNISNEKNVLYMAVDSKAPTLPELASMLSGLSTKVEKDISLNQIKPKNINIALDKYENNLIIDIETYLDNNQNYKNIITINKFPPGPLQRYIRKVPFNTLSPFKNSQGYNKCGLAITKFDNFYCLLTPCDIPELFSYLIENNYKIDTSITKLINNSEIVPCMGKKIICFFSYL